MIRLTLITALLSLSACSFNTFNPVHRNLLPQILLKTRTEVDATLGQGKASTEMLSRGFFVYPNGIEIRFDNGKAVSIRIQFENTKNWKSALKIIGIDVKHNSGPLQQVIGDKTFFIWGKNNLIRFGLYQLTALWGPGSQSLLINLVGNSTHQ